MGLDFARPVGYLTDPHGNTRLYDRFFRLCRAQRAQALILGGDLTPKSPALQLADNRIVPVSAVLSKREPYRNTVAEGLARFKDHTLETARSEGLFIHRVADSEIDFERLYREQVLLDKIFQTLKFNSAAGPVYDGSELEFIAKYIQPLIARLENDGTIVLGNYQQKARKAVDLARDCSLDKLKLSSVLVKGLTSWEELLRMRAVSKKIEYLFARNVLRCYSADLIARIAQFSLIYQLQESAVAFPKVRVEQAGFMENYLIPQLTALKQEGIKVFAQLGNDDLAENAGLLADLPEAGYLHQRVMPLLEDFQIAGYSFVNPVPGVGYRGWFKEDQEIEADLSRIFASTNPRRTVYVFHVPPFGTALDQNFGGTHIGSQALSRAITKYNPYLLLFGHAHASPRVSGRYYERLGESHAFQPGPDILFFDLLDPVRHWHAEFSSDKISEE